MSVRQSYSEAVEPPAQDAASRVRGIALIVVAAALSLGSLALLIVLLAPGLSGVSAGTHADGTESFQLVAAPGSGSNAAPATPTVVSIVPAPDWWVQPVSDGGLLLRSPDRVVTVEMTVLPESVAQAALDDAMTAVDPLSSETLSSGLKLQHFTSDSLIVGVLQLREAVLLIEAQTTQPREFGGYRPALSQLLASVTVRYPKEK